MEPDLRPRMSALALGGWIGFLDTLALSIALSGHHADDRFGATLKILLVTLMPGMLLGFMLGAVVRALPMLRVAARRAIALGPPLVIVFGIAFVARARPTFFLVLLPMIACSLYLERATRGAGDLPDLGSQRMPRSGASALGAVIGSCNAIFIAVATGLQDGGDTGVLVLLFGIVPALAIGYLLGMTAAMLVAKPVWVRCAVLVLVPAGLLLLLAAPLGLVAMFVPALIPTAVCGLVLERATRHVAELPFARARVTSDPAGPSPKDDDRLRTPP